MKKRTSNVSRRIVSLLMSMVLTLTLVTPAAFATEVVGGSGTAIIEGNANPADANPNEDTEGKDDVDKNAEDEQQPAEPDDENAEPSEGEDAVNEPSNEADTQEGEGTDTPVVAQRTVTVERYRTDAAYEVKIVVGVEEDGTTEKLDTTYAIDADTKTVTLKLTTADYAGGPIYIKTALDDVLVTEGENQTPALTKDDLTLKYTLPEDGDVTLYYGTQADFVSSWYGDGSATEYTIRTAEELAYFAQLVNGTATDSTGDIVAAQTFSGKVITLARDIDLSAVCHPADEESGIAEVSWTPIGRRAVVSFAGTFDGNGYTIGNMSVTVANNSGQAGLFGWLSGTVQNLIVTGEIKLEGCKTSLFVGSIAGQAMKSTITKCNSRVNITVQSFSKAASVGGLAGAGNGTVKNCLNEGRILVESTQAVGNTIIGGIASGGCAVNACWNTGEITVEVPKATGKIYVGGMIGQNGNNVLVNCYNGGAIKVMSNADSNMECLVGGIAGKAGNKGVHNSYNLGDVMCTKAGTAYGISSAAVTNSYYICKINSAEEDTKKYFDSDRIEQSITYEEAARSYKVGENTLVKTLNDNKGDGLKWFVNISEGITKPIFVKQWDGTDHPDYVPDGTKREVHVTYDPNGGGGSGTSVSVAVTLNEDGTVKTPGSHTILTAEAAGVEKDNNEFKDWNTAADGSGTPYVPNDVISVSEDLTLYAQWQPLWKGSGTESDPYQIENEADWLKMQKYAGKYKYYRGAWFALMNDITLDSSYEPFNFAGNLKGNHHAITVNIPKTTENGKHSRGLFDSLAGGTDGLLIENLTIAGSVTAFQYAGGLAGSASNKVTLENVTSNVTVQAGGDQYDRTSAAGGLFGTYNGGGMYPLTVKNCTNSGTVTAYQAAGFVATMNSEANMSFSGCQNTGAITGKGAYGDGYAAGFVSIHNAYNLTCTFENCANSGTISANACAAGIAIRCRLAANCTNSGTISGNIAGGILESGAVKYSTNTGEINGKSCAAGIAAASSTGRYTVEFCANFGKVTATAGIGVAKRAYGIASQGTVKNCFTYNNEAHVPVAGATGRNCIITNSYYLANSKDEFPSTMGGEWASEADFASGKVAWGVGGKGEGSQGGTGQDAKLGWWKQDKNDAYPTLLDNPDMSKRYYRTDVDCGTGGEVELARNASSTVKELSSKEAVYGPAGTSVTIKATPKDNTFGLKSLTWTHNGQTDVLPAAGTTNIVMPAESNGTIHAEFASVGPGGNGGYYYGGSGDGTGTGDKDDEGLQDGLNMDVEYDIKGLVLGAYAEWGSNGGNKSFQKWLEENPNVVRALLTNSLDNMATAAVGKKTDEAKDLAALLLASLNEHTGVDGKNGDTIAKALQKYIDSGSEEVFSAWLTGGGGMASGTYESIYGQYASSLAALADRLYSKWEASGTSMTFPVWLDSQQVTMESLSENAEEPDAEPDDTQTTEAPEDVPDGQDTEGGASGNSVWEVIGTVVRENPIIVWSIVAVVAALVIVGAVRRYHKVKRDERDDVASKK